MNRHQGSTMELTEALRAYANWLGTSNDEGVPLAVQLVGRRGSDWSLLALADALEQLAPSD